MHCPKCGQLQVSDDTRFCSRCGLLLTGIAQVVAHGGVIPNTGTELKKAGSTPRNRGLKQGLFIFLLAFLVVPILAIFTVMARAEPFAVVLSAIFLTVGGMLRAAYALMFESNVSVSPELAATGANASPGFLSGASSAGALPPNQSVPADSYISPSGRWRDTNDLAANPPSVTDSTTKLLQKETDDQ